MSNLQPGSHRIEISKSGYRPKTVDKELAAGGAISLSAADASLDVAAGSLALDVKPAGATLLVETRQAQIRTENKRHSPAPRRLQLPAGQYSLTFSASGHETMTVNVELVDRETKEIPVELTRQQRRVELPKKGGMEGFTAGGWTAQDGWQTRRGGDFVLYERQPSAGAFTFTVRPPAGGLFRKQPPLQWFANYTDQRNYVLFRIDGKNFSRIQVKNGATKELAKKPHGLDSKKDCQ
ncbi:MAG: PEGA domain-containing protein, partial [bacterium]|nr:PEGA domain-containing protein [bacterium]